LQVADYREVHEENDMLKRLALVVLTTAVLAVPQVHAQTETIQ
jgi:hypothetical protein